MQIQKKKKNQYTNAKGFNVVATIASAMSSHKKFIPSDFYTPMNWKNHWPIIF